MRALQTFLLGVALVVLTARALPPRSYDVVKDVQVEFLTAWALRDGLDPLTPLDQLAQRYISAATPSFPHPSPYPPVVAVLALPLTLLPYAMLVPTWLLANVLLLLVVGRYLGFSIRGSLALAAWPPMFWLLDIAQLEVLILALVVLGWRAAARGRDVRAGVWLGLAATIKLYPAIFLVPFLVRRRFRLAAIAIALLLAAQFVGLAVVGPTGLGRYYLEVLPDVPQRYVGFGLNGSPYGALLRLFGGAADVTSPVDAPSLVVPLAIAISVVAALALLRVRPEAAPLAVLLLLPNVWWYYSVLALPEIVFLLRQPQGRIAALIGTVSLSVTLPVVNLALPPLVTLIGLSGPALAWVLAILLALQPIGCFILLFGSLAHDGWAPPWRTGKLGTVSTSSLAHRTSGGDHPAQTAISGIDRS